MEEVREAEMAPHRKKSVSLFCIGTLLENISRLILGLGTQLWGRGGEGGSGGEGGTRH